MAAHWPNSTRLERLIALRRAGKLPKVRTWRGRVPGTPINLPRPRSVRALHHGPAYLALVAALLGLWQLAASYDLIERSIFNVNAVMGIILFLALIGYLVSRGMTLVERRLSRWQLLYGARGAVLHQRNLASPKGLADMPPNQVTGLAALDQRLIPRSLAGRGTVGQPIIKFFLNAAPNPTKVVLCIEEIGQPGF